MLAQFKKNNFIKSLLALILFVNSSFLISAEKADNVTELKISLILNKTQNPKFDCHLTQNPYVKVLGETALLINYEYGKRHSFPKKEIRSKKEFLSLFKKRKIFSISKWSTREKVNPVFISLKSLKEINEFVEAQRQIPDAIVVKIDERGLMLTLSVAGESFEIFQEGESMTSDNLSPEELLQLAKDDGRPFKIRSLEDGARVTVGDNGEINVVVEGVVHGTDSHGTINIEGVLKHVQEGSDGKGGKLGLIFYQNKQGHYLIKRVIGSINLKQSFDEETGFLVNQFTFPQNNKMDVVDCSKEAFSYMAKQMAEKRQAFYQHAQVPQGTPHAEDPLAILASLIQRAINSRK